ncbi:MAG: glycine--tRNA ligase subunit beta [Endomicrobiia bacterium]
MSKNKNLLIEIYVEEFPVRFLSIILEQMPEIVKNVLSENKIIFKEVEIFVTPTRIVIWVDNVSEFTQRVETEILGPNVNIGLKNGEYTDAAKGFAKKNGVELKDLYVKTTPKGDFLTVKKCFGGELVKTVLPEVVRTIFTKNIFPKNMVWEETKFKFPRPIRNILILFGNEIVKTNLSGIKTSDTTFGIKTFPIKRIKIKGKPPKPSSECYFEIMENENILVNHKKRLETLKKMLDNITAKKKLQYEKDENLLEEINMLIEYPSCVVCEFPEHFLSLPKEVIIMCMKIKQKFIPLFDTKGNLINNFIGIKNGCSEYLNNVKNGYEKVLIARLNDAKFFYETDLKTCFEDRTKLLEKIIYNYKIDSMYSDKITRIKLLAEYLNLQSGFNFDNEIIEKTSKIIKNDITTLMVQEYPELQGTMGKLYSLSQGIDMYIAEVCEQHYFPQQFNASVPENKLSILFAIATKLSDIIDNALVDDLPTGTSDPFGLKKTCDGLIKIFIEKELDLSLEEIINYYVKKCSITRSGKVNWDFTSVNKKIVDFIKQRMENIYLSLNFKIDEIRVVLSNFSGNFWSTTKCLESISKNRSNKEFSEVVDIYVRINNILRQGKQKYGLTFHNKEIDKSLLKLQEEIILIENLTRTQTRINDLYEQKDFKKIIEEIINLKPVINNFFDKVLVFDTDEKIAFNRVLILDKMFQIFNCIGQLDLIQQ